MSSSRFIIHFHECHHQVLNHFLHDGVQTNVYNESGGGEEGWERKTKKNIFFPLAVLEYCSEKDRIIPLWTVMLSYSLSSILTPVMSMYLSSWRALLAMATLPNFLVILADFFGLIPESLRWLLCKGRKENALKLVHKIAKFNRVQLNVSITLDCKKH